MGYASNTKVPVLQTQSEIVAQIVRMGATDYGIMQVQGQPAIVFKRGPLSYRFSLNIPEDANEQRVRSLWRSLGLVVKAKCVAIEEGVSTFEQEFMPHILGKGNVTLGEKMEQRLAALPPPSD